jgi:hypothetical protein
MDAQDWSIGAQRAKPTKPYAALMHLTNLCSKFTKLVSLGGMLVFVNTGFSMDGTVAVGMATASSGGGGGIAIELWFVLMLALLGAAQWLDHKEAEMITQRVRVAHEDVNRRTNAR